VNDELTDEQIQERDPVALQQKLLDIGRSMNERMPTYQEKHEAFQAARSAFEVEKLRFKLWKQEMQTIQSVLKSLNVK